MNEINLDAPKGIPTFLSMDQDNRRSQNKELTFGPNKYLQMAMFMCLFTKDELLSEVYDRRPTDFIIEDQKRFLAELEKPRKTSSRSTPCVHCSVTPPPSSSSSPYFKSYLRNDGENKVVKRNDSTDNKWRQMPTSNIPLKCSHVVSNAYKRKLAAARKYERAKNNKLRPGEGEEAISLSTLTSMRTTFDIFTPVDMFSTLSDTSYYQTPSYDTEYFKNGLRNDLTCDTMTHFDRFYRFDEIDRFNEIDQFDQFENEEFCRECQAIQNNYKSTKLLKKSISLNNSTQNLNNCDVHSTNSAPDKIEIHPNEEHVENENKLNENIATKTNDNSLKEGGINNNLVATNKETVTVKNNLLPRNFKRLAINLNYNGLTQGWQDTSPKLPKLVATNNHVQLPVIINKKTVPMNIKKAECKIAAPQINKSQNHALLSCIKPKNLDVPTEEVYCLKMVKQLKANVAIYSMLKDHIFNIDESFDLLSTPVEQLVTKLNGDDKQTPSQSPDKTPSNLPTNYMIEKIITEVIEAKFCDLSTDIEKIIANHSSTEFHNIAQLYPFDVHNKLKEFRRKVRNKYAARICRQKRLTETEILKRRNEELQRILRVVKDYVDQMASNCKFAPKNTIPMLTTSNAICSNPQNNIVTLNSDQKIESYN